jgi:hypothetical protein
MKSDQHSPGGSAISLGVKPSHSSELVHVATCPRRIVMILAFNRATSSLAGIGFPTFDIRGSLNLRDVSPRERIELVTILSVCLTSSKEVWNLVVYFSTLLLEEQTPG